MSNFTSDLKFPHENIVNVSYMKYFKNNYQIDHFYSN